MAEEIIQARLWTKVDTLDNWNNNPLLLGPGELALVTNGQGVPMNMKWGDKTTRKRFSELPFAIAYDQGQFVAITGTVLPASTVGKVRYSLVGEGTYTRTGMTSVVVPAGKMGIIVDDGSIWILGSSVPLPTVDTTGLVAKNELQVDSTSINKFNYQTAENGYVDPATGADMPASDYKRSAPISLVGNTTGKLALSGLGTIHHGLGWKVMDAAGAILLRGASAIDVTNFIIDYTSVIANAHSFKFTCKTNKSGDNTNLQNVQVEFGDIINGFQPFGNILTGIDDAGFKASDINGKKTVVGKNKFLKTSITNGYIVVSNGSYNNYPTLKRTLKISLEGNTSNLVTISGLGTIHWGLGWRTNDANGNLLQFGQSAQDVTKFTIDYASSAANAKTIEITVLTNKSGDNTNLDNVQIEWGGIATTKVPYTTLISQLLSKDLVAAKALKADYPVADDDIVPLGYLNTTIVTGSKLKGKLVFVLADSITEDTNSWIRQAIPLMGGILVNFARSGARAGDHPTTAINLSPAVPINSPDNTLSNQVRRAAQATTALGQEITWTHPVTGEVFGVPTAIGTGTGTRTAPDVIIIALTTNDTLYTDDFSTVKDLTLSSLPNTQLVGGLRWAVENLMILYPNAQIILCTPIQSQPGGSRPFNVTKVKRDRVVEVANYYSLEVIDAFYESGINEKFEIAGNGRYLSDGLHPNDAGKAKMRDYLINELNEKVVVRRS